MRNHSLSSAQRSLWLAYTLRPETHGDFNVSLSMRTRPALEPARLQRALERLAAHHPMLRARIAECGGRSVQVIHAEARVPLRVVEVTDLNTPEIAALDKAERTRAFDLANEPPIKAMLYRAGPSESVVSIVLDHLVCDGWSFFQLLEELGAILEAQGSGHEWLAVPERASFTDYVAYEHEWLQGTKAAQQLEYWQNVFAHARPSAELRHDLVSEPGELRRPSLVRLLPAELSRALTELTRELGVSMFATIVAAYGLMLHRASGADELSIGTVMPVRGERWRKTIGNFVNPVVMPIKLAPDMTLPELLRSLHEVAFRTLRNKDYPFDELVSALEPYGIRPGGAHLKTCMVFHKARKAQQLTPVFTCCHAGPPVRWGGVEVEAFGEHISSGFADQDLKLEAVEFEDRLCVSWTYDAARFARPTIEAFATSFETLLAAMTRDRNASVRQLPWVSADQVRQLETWNAACLRSGDERPVHAQFEARADQTPHAVALRFADDTLTYSQLNARANQLAAYLRSLGVGPESRVALCAERSFELVTALLATLKAGGAFVPLDPAYPAARLDYMLRDSAPSVILASSATRGRLHSLGVTCPVIELDMAEGPWTVLPSTNPDPAEVGLTGQNLAYVIYTSGSTGAPKGVMNEHRGLANLVAAQAELFGVDASSRILQFASPSFDASVSEIALALTQGASLHLAEPSDLMPGRPLLTLLARHEITHVTLPPAALPLCEDPDIPFTPSTLIVAGEAIRLSEANKWAQRVATLINAYGPSETSVCATAHRCLPNASSVPIGRPIANARVYVLDPAGRPVPIGMGGEIYIGGTPVGRGYLNRPDLTLERFLPDPFSPQAGARMYRTGDLGRFLPDGTLEFRGRSDYQIKLRGFRIELDEIRLHLSSLEGVSDVAVLVREDVPGDKRIVAYYCGAGAPEPHALRAHATAALPDYMVPSAFVRLDALPLTPSGKLDRKALPIPDRLSTPSVPYEAPASALEAAVARIWSDLLGVAKIGRDDDFFHLGGHSLKAVEVISRLHREVGRTVALRDLFAHPRLCDFAATVERAGASRSHASNLVCLRAYGPSQPLFGVHPLGGTVEYLRLLAPHLDPQLPLYGLAASAWDGEEAATASIPEIAARYVDGLRNVQPKGPYCILGYSVGGVIAHAMAETLLERGELVEFLGIIDTHPDLGGLPEFRALMERIDRTEVEKGSAAADELYLEHVMPYLVPSHAVSSIQVAGPTEILRSAVRAMRATTRALCDYKPAPLPLHVDLFLAEDDVMFDLAAAWTSRMPHRVRAVRVPGSHTSMLEPRNIRALALAITAGLAHARPARTPLRVRDSIQVTAYAAQS